MRLRDQFKQSRPAVDYGNDDSAHSGGFSVAGFDRTIPTPWDSILFVIPDADIYGWQVQGVYSVVILIYSYLTFKGEHGDKLEPEGYQPPCVELNDGLRSSTIHRAPPRKTLRGCARLGSSV